MNRVNIMLDSLKTLTMDTDAFVKAQTVIT